MGNFFYIHNVRKDSCISKTIFISVNQLPTVSYICGNHRFMCRIAFKDRQRLTLTDTGEQGKVHLPQIIPYINPSCKFYILNPQRFHQIITFLCIFFIFIRRSHDPEFHILHSFFRKSKCLYHSFDIFDRSYTEYCSCIDKLLLFFRLARKTCKCFYINSIWCYSDLLSRTSKFNLQFSGMIIQTGYHICIFICKK